MILPVFQQYFGQFLIVDLVLDFVFLFVAPLVLLGKVMVWLGKVSQGMGCL